jgi:LssY-like putative type I secretion system component LssY
MTTMKLRICDLDCVLMLARVFRVRFAFPALIFLLTVSHATGTPADPSAKDVFASRSVTQQQGPITVRAVVLTDDESQRHFGAALADEGIQAIWLSVENSSDLTLHYLPVTTDPNYFTPSETARLFHGWLPGEANTTLDARFAREAMPEIIPPRQTATGFVLTHREGGLKFLRVGFIGGGQQFDFRFVMSLDSVTYAVQKVDFDSIHPAGSIEEVDLIGLRSRLESLPCCTASAADKRVGDPLNLVIIGNGTDGIFPFIMRGWRLDEPLDFHSALRSVRAFLFGTEYLNAPVSPLYVFGRAQDISLQKARDKISLRNHLRVWLAPFTIGGQHVWVGQISRDIGIKLTTQSWYLTTHRISPDVDDDRYYLLQDLIMTGEVSKFGFVRGVGTSTHPNPRTNLTGDPYLTDGLRLVVFLGRKEQRLKGIEFLEWEHPRP